MDIFLGKVTSQAINYAIRSGVAITASYAIKQSTKLLNNTPRSTTKDELYVLQQRLQHKIRIISPAIDMIELIAARGNTSLESAISLTKELRLDIQALGQRLASAAHASEQTSRTSQVNAAAKLQHELELKGIVSDIKTLLSRIEDAIPLINLAITTSGVSLSSNLPHTVSPSRLLQASTFLTAGDTQYSMSPQTAVQIGPTFTLTVYMLFVGHNRPQTEDEVREATWKEVMHKARVKLRRVPLDLVLKTGSGSAALATSEIHASSQPVFSEDSIMAEVRSHEYAYQIVVVEDFDDDRVHDFDDDQTQPGAFEDVAAAGMREIVPIHEISKIFYADTSKVLNIGTDAESNHPVLLLKRDLNAVPPRRMAEHEAEDKPETPEQSNLQDTHADTTNTTITDPWRLPPSLDPEWMAFEVYSETESDDDISDPGDVTNTSLAGLQPTRSLDDHIASMHISSPDPKSPQGQPPSPADFSTSQLTTNSPQPPPWQSQIRTSLSLLELLLRLTALQQFQQQSHLSITDELLNFFLEESASTGAGGNEQYRQAVRANARRRVGWDPYDESPVKRRGEDYQYGYQDGAGYGNTNGWSPGPPTPNQGVSPRPSLARNGSAGRHSYGNGSAAGNSRRQSYNEGWSPAPASAGGLQTRSITRVDSSGSSGFVQQGGADGAPSPSPLQNKSREQWLRRDSGRGKAAGVGSPLRPTTGRSDEGLGTSPVSGFAGQGGARSP